MARRGSKVSVWSALAAAPAFLLVVLFASYATLPDVRPLAQHNPETTAFIELRTRQARKDGDRQKRVQRWVSYGRLSSQLRHAVLVTEDSAFFTHGGIDLEELKKSMEVNLDRMAFVRGGSTITQQLAKNLYLSPSKDPLRKFRELMIARLLEGALTKQRILELYLNVIEWGDGIYGADAAARTYFGVPAAGVSAEQAALLAGAIANPHLLNPHAPSRRLLRRQRMILRLMGYGGARPAEPEATPEIEPDLPTTAKPVVPEPHMEPTPVLPGTVAPVPQPFPQPSPPAPKSPTSTTPPGR